VELKLAPDDTPLGEVYQFHVVSDRHTDEEMRSELEWTISRILRQVPGVADVVTFGGYLKEIHVEVDPSRLLAHDLTTADVSSALAQSNRNCRRRLSAPRRSAAHHPGRRLPAGPARREGCRTQERQRDAGDDR
jgi:Cu/Ag efflux pump CusA